MYDFDTPIDRIGTDCTKWDALERDFGNPSLFPMWIADMDFSPFPDLQLELMKRAGSTTYGYTFAGKKYLESVIGWNLRRSGYVINHEEIISVPGVLCGLCFVIAALSDAGDRILINTPVYDCFYDVLKELGRAIACSPLLYADGKYRIDYENLERQFASGIKLFIFCSPHNPLGRVWEHSELIRLIELCDKYSVTVVSDEIHADLVYAGHKHIPLHNVSQRAREIAIVLKSPSKTFNMAGLKIAMLIIKEPLIRERIRAMIASFHVTVNLFGYKATEIVYSRGERWVDELVLYLEKNARFTFEFFAEKLPMVKTFIPEGTYLMWADFSNYGLTQDKIMSKMQNEAGVAVNSGLEYGEEGLGCVRLNIGMPRIQLKEGLEKIARVF